MAVNIQSQNTSQPPLRPIYEFANGLRRTHGVASLSIVLGFPYADVPEMGSSLIVVTDNYSSTALRESVLDQLESEFQRSKDQFEPDFIGPETAVAAAADQEGLTCLLDMGDNVGGGSPGDGTILAAELHRRSIGRSLVCLADPDAIAQLAGKAIGEEVEGSFGGKTDRLHGKPLRSTVRILSRHDGVFHESEPRHGGFSRFDQGETVVVETVESEITIMLTAKRMPPFSLSQLTTHGIEPDHFRAIVAKGVIAPMAAYEEVANQFIHVNTPGVTCADMRSLTYKHRRQPMFPFEQ